MTTVKIRGSLPLLAVGDRVEVRGRWGYVETVSANRTEFTYVIRWEELPDGVLGATTNHRGIYTERLLELEGVCRRIEPSVWDRLLDDDE